MKLHRFESYRLRWIYRITGPILVPLWLFSLIEGIPWYFIPTTVIALMLWTYFSVSAWLR